MYNPFAIPDFVQELLAVSNQGVNQIVQKLSTLLSHSVLVTDSLYQALLCSTGNEGVEEMVVMHKTHSRSQIRKFQSLHARFQPLTL